MTYEVHSIGTINHTQSGTFLALEPRYIPALQALDGFSHLNVLWWFNGYDNQEARDCLEVGQPYQQAPPKMGVFATRSPMRPNPIALTAVEIIDINHQTGSIQIAYIDANENTPILDLKPYTPSLDRVEAPEVPEWCRHWPKSLEQSAFFDWETEFNF